MSLYAILGILSAVIFSAAYFPYIISVARGKSRPHPVSWILWAVIGALNLFFSVKVGAHDTLPLVLMDFVLPAILVPLSLKYWKGGLSRFDLVCLAFFILSIVAYAIFHNAAFSLTLSVLADMFAYLPTIRKTYLDPSSEDLLTWALFTIGYSLSIAAAISHFTYGVVVLPLYLTAFGIIMVALIFRGTLKKSR